MPVTPLHYPIAKIIHMLGGKVSLVLPALFVGSMVPDLEVPFVYLWSGSQDRLVLHSLLGGLTLGTVIAVGLTVYLYSTIMSKILPIDKTLVRKKCQFSFMLVFCSLLGVLSHVLLDLTNHSYNPLFWPFKSLNQTSSPIVSLLGGEIMASLIVHGSMIILTIGLLWKNRQDPWNKTFVG